MINNSLKIRPARKNDINLLARIKLGSGYKIYEFKPTTLVEQIEKIRSRMTAGMCYLIAELDGKAAAMIAFHQQFILKDNFIFQKPALPGAEIFSLYVLKEYAGKKIGHRLMQYAENKIKKTGGKRVYSLTWEKNEFMLRIYPKLSYNLVGKDPKHFSNGDASLIFVKELSTKLK